MAENVAKSRSSRATGRIFFYLAVVILLFFVLFPMFWMFLASFKTNADILNMSKLFNFTPTMKNFENVFVNYDFAKPIINSLIVSLVSTVLSLILGLPAAYSIAREKQHLFSGIILMIRIVPAVSLPGSLVHPVYQPASFRNLSILDHLPFDCLSPVDRMDHDSIL